MCASAPSAVTGTIKPAHEPLFQAESHTGGQALTKAALEHRFCISVLGVVTFRNASGLRAIVPLDRLLIETDPPALAPVPHRGERIRSAFVAITAALRCIRLAALAQPRTGNFFRLFSNTSRPATPSA